MTAINLKDKLSKFNEHWTPKIIGNYNDSEVMVAKLKGEFNWHSHPDTDDFFYVIKGALEIELRDQVIHLEAGDLYIVPKGVEHRPVAREEVHVMLIETVGTPNSGDEATAAFKEKI